MVTDKSAAAKAAKAAAKAASFAKLSPPVKHMTPPKSPNPYDKSPKKKEVKSHNIVILVNNDGTPYGLAFEGFYNGKEFVKALSNRNNALTYLGGLEFKLFSNLTTKWIISSKIGVCLWVLRIDATMDGTEGCFPMDAHTA